MEQSKYTHIRANIEQEQSSMHVIMMVEAIKRLVGDWDRSSDEDRHSIRNLIELLVWDFDQKKIVDFKLKREAQKFVI